MSRRLWHSLLIPALLLCSSSHVLAAAEKTLQTRFATIRYSQDREVGDFLWRITGKRLAPIDGTQLVKNRVDELVERVETLLEMYPSPFQFSIQLEAHTFEDPAALYSHRTRTITFAVDRVTDGVLAHEIAHAVINAYFPAPPPEKVQEILAQYVDEHLYNLY
ncbi:MAG: hypothetical protein COT00_00375 [Candidatus Omnitrophica bacterium CG07_land_8_20_14_0_80_50_8]|nr:MAG: hypothetical protein AUJ71_04450 [Candidatus Omnitrophica bacterium CG1_02_49_16]PIU40693.1 MAG: hypothetical protein COT00_00375 [Candidatus Omnitrophica bacterium CG07_land_8_20_14_0_80_50_8]